MNRTWLLVASLFGLTVPNGLFLFWALHEYRGLRELLSDHLAMAFILDAVLAVVVIAYAIARRAGATVRWPKFVALSLIGGLGFSIPFSLWLEMRNEAKSA